MRPILALVLSAAAAFAGEWVRLDDAGITSALSGQRLDYGSAWQTFDADGGTLYDAGRPSRGFWRVEGGQYCSQWPPRSEWACYQVEQAGDRVRFIGGAGEVTEGRYAE